MCACLDPLTETHFFFFCYLALPAFIWGTAMLRFAGPINLFLLILMLIPVSSAFQMSAGFFKATLVGQEIPVVCIPLISYIFCHIGAL